jgi:hypothetical protein
MKATLLCFFLFDLNNTKAVLSKVSLVPQYTLRLKMFSPVISAISGPSLFPELEKRRILNVSVL